MYIIDFMSEHSGKGIVLLGGDGVLVRGLEDKLVDGREFSVAHKSDPSFQHHKAIPN